MESLTRHVRSALEGFGLPASGARLVVAVSGGADSCALLLALTELREPLKLTLHVAHLNHGLRVAAAHEAAFVRALAERFSLPCVLGTDEVAARARERKQSIEQAARSARYEFLEATAKSVGADWIALGHTADDQVETVLLHLARGTGLRGLAGMPARRGPFVRPLLAVSRAATEAFCRQHQVEYRDDESNRDRRFARNRVRAELLPILRQINAGFDANLLRTAELLADEEALLNHWAERELDRLAACGDDGSLWQPVSLRLSRAGLLCHPRALQRRILRCGIARVRGHCHQVEFHHVEGALAALASGATHGCWNLPGGSRLRVQGDAVVLTGPPRSVPAWLPRELPVPGTVSLPELGAVIEARLVNRAEWPCVKLKQVRAGCLDAGRVGRLCVRPPQAGDRIRPLGMTGTKKLSAYLAELRVPPELRGRVPVIESEHRPTGECGILWVAGGRIDERWKVMEQTESVLLLSIELTADATAGAVCGGD